MERLKLVVYYLSLMSSLLLLVLLLASCYELVDSFIAANPEQINWNSFSVLLIVELIPVAIAFTSALLARHHLLLSGFLLLLAGLPCIALEMQLLENTAVWSQLVALWLSALLMSAAAASALSAMIPIRRVLQ
ncbi:MAG: hypothetical protein HXX08_05500 [Chloroflexi bacterium]|uniref:Uncharacterized protein n=1 Tax=Candidatus Chlorohelix allophototropha TaxID=3003348 RepID=A0A8T7LWS1_9CHLR|nr:hypothetical protein [Chloroflexota bacterium]WJW67192.1 hypothetical protein OZ401_000448 [Chloroflexota bacterium L227-S17]